MALRKQIQLSANYQSTEIRNYITNIPLPLMIFIRMHFQESQFHNKCLICSIMSIIYVQVATFVRALGTHIQTLVQVRHNVGQKVILQVVETFQTKYIQTKIPSLGCFYHKSSLMFQPFLALCLEKPWNAGRYHVKCA
jgi:hypothetical protein